MANHRVAMEPLSISLDILQGENNMCFEYLVPTIVLLTSKYELMIQSHTLLKCDKPLITAILDGKQLKILLLREPLTHNI